MMQKTLLGNTAIEVTRLGLGLAEIARKENGGDERGFEQVLNTALDGGINFLDTAACYGATEKLIGRAVSHRREEYALATKCGHVVGTHDGRPWAAQTIEDSIDRSLRSLNTDHLDIVQLHSCGVEVLEDGDAIGALIKARAAGKTIYIGYSGDNEAALWAIDSGLFDTLQTSFNPFDQHARTRLFERAEARGMGIIVKRPIANGVWGKDTSPSAYADEYFRRAQIVAGMGPIPGSPEDPVLLNMGFALAHPEVDTVIVGTHNPSHVSSNIELVQNRLPIPDEAVEELRRRFDQVGNDWRQLT